MPRQLALFGGGKQLMGSPRKLAPFERILELDRAALKLVREQGWSVPDAYRAASASGKTTLRKNASQTLQLNQNKRLNALSPVIA